MSARRVLRRNAKIIANNTINKLIPDMKIRTYQDLEQYQMLSQPSHFLWTRTSIKSELRTQLLKLKKLAAYRKLVYLSDIQVQSFFNVFVVYRNPLQNKWYDESYNNEGQFDLYANPKIQKYLGQNIQAQQICHSFPFMKCLVDRSSKILVNYTKITNLDENQNKLKTEYATEQIEGFKSIVFQHCMDHIQGKHFFTPELSKGRISFQIGGKLYEKTKFLVRQYNVRIKKALQEQKTGSEQFKKVKKDYQDRIRKEFQEESKKAEQQFKKYKNYF